LVFIAKGVGRKISRGTNGKKSEKMAKRLGTIKKNSTVKPLLGGNEKKTEKQRTHCFPLPTPMLTVSLLDVQH